MARCCFNFVLIFVFGQLCFGILTNAAEQRPSKAVTESGYRNAYITDIVDQLRNQIWPPSEQHCLNQTIAMLTGVQNHTLWSTWAWESMNHLPVGQMYGSRHHLGNYDECMTSSWSAHRHLSTQYCLANVLLSIEAGARRNVTTVNPYGSTLDFMQYHTRYSRRIDSFVWGLCVPALCSVDSARMFAKVMLEMSPWNVTGLTANVTIDQCQNPGDPTWPPYDIGFFVFTGVAVTLISISLLCTVVVYFNGIGSHPDKMVWYFIRAFDITSNSKDLLRFEKDELEALYGVRFLSIMLLVMGHQIMYYNIGPISNGWKADQDLDSPMASLVIHDDLLVDTFFFMSGVLFMRAFLFLKRMPSFFGALMKRYIRLAPSLAMVIFYINTTLKFSGAGPLWPNYVKHETTYCLKNWWTNLLMVNNFVDPENMCYHNTWYIPCDFQMFTAAVLLAQLWAWKPSLSDVTLYVLMVLAVFIPGFVTYYYNLAPIPMMVYETLLNSRKSFELNVFYIRTYNRFGPYLVGMLAQRYLSSPKNYCPKSSKRKVWSTLCAWIGMVLMLGVLLYGARLHRLGWTNWESVIFAALNRTIWATGLALLIIGCGLSEVPLVKQILTWYPWVPLSKLAFGIYITHGLIIYRNIFVTRNLQHHDDGNIAMATMGVLMWSTIAAYLLWIFVDAPVSNVFNIIMTPRGMLKKMMDKMLTKEDIKVAMEDRMQCNDNSSKCNQSI